MSIDKTHDPGLSSWIEVSPGSDFPIQNLPFGIARSPKHAPRAVSRIGDQAIDLAELGDWGYLNGTGITDFDVFRKEYLNDFIALGRPVWKALRERLSYLFDAEHGELRDNAKARAKMLYPISGLEMMLPVRIGDYTDFYASIEHATNVGMMFRNPANALLPNWKHLPVGYHGRSSSIVISGTNIHRPNGQYMAEGSASPVFGPSTQLDFELEVAFIAGCQTKLGSSISTENAEDCIFGLVLFNDLSARDIQKWEYVPLGPFLGKNFGSVISPWIVTMDALEPLRISGPIQETQVLPYLGQKGDHNFNINLEVSIAPDGKEPVRICRSNFRHMYWSMAQQLVHHTVNGCNINIGDMCASGTISGPDPGSFGSMLELSWNGTKPLTLYDGEERTYIHDLDTVIMKGYGEYDKVRIGFGECITQILPAKKT